MLTRAASVWRCWLEKQNHPLQYLTRLVIFFLSDFLLFIHFNQDVLVFDPINRRTPAIQTNSAHSRESQARRLEKKAAT